MMDSFRVPATGERLSTRSSEEPSTQDYVSFSVDGVGKTPATIPEETTRGFFYNNMSNENRKLFVQSMYMSVFAILGALLRIVVAQLFGDECRNPGTVGWLKAASPLCVTADGDTDQQGGIVFADLPANLFGSFIMGLMQTTTALDLPGSFPVAWLTPGSIFQSWDILHLAIRTGFCGSLTTFSSWNSEMVVMIVGTGHSHTSRFARALFGYTIGMETALGSFVFGKKVAEWLYRWKNPLMAQEADALHAKQAEGVYIHTALPDFERRFLSNLSMDYMGPEQHNNTGALERWRVSTQAARRVGHPRLPALLEIERAILVEQQVRIPPHHDNEDWDTASLLTYRKGMPPKAPTPVPNDSFLFVPAYAAAILAAFVVPLVLGVILIRRATAYAITYRTMLFAAILAPPGALLRWHLSQYNGKLLWSSWLPVGTLAANLIGSLVSILMIAFEYVLPLNGFWIIASLRAVKVGFAGSLTTVSTFVSELSALMKNKLTNDMGYMYMVLTLGSACVLSLAAYLVIFVISSKI